MKRILIVVVAIAAIAAVSLPSITQGADTTQQVPIFRSGPEIHLRPSFGPVGTKVAVAGLGFKSGTKVKILYGRPNSELELNPLARATVSANGTFRTSFTISRVLVDRARPGATPLIIGTFTGGAPSQPGGKMVGTALIVTVA